MGEEVEAWRAVAAGWERHRELAWASTRPVSERLVELLDPQPGETILDLAAGPGDTGFLAAPRLQPGGRLVSTDFAPEMVAAARRRAVELGLAVGVSFAVEDMAALSLADASVDGVLCRWGLMLVPDMDTAAGEIARVVRAAGRGAGAVGADPPDNHRITAAGRSAGELGLVERPDPEAPGPFRLSGDGRLRDVLEGRGLLVETVEDVPLTWRAASLDEWWEVVRDMSRTLTLILESITPDQADAVRARAGRQLERYLQPDGSLAVPGVARVALARRPD